MATSGTFERPISIFIEIFPLNKGNLGLSFSPPAGTAAVSFNFFTKIHSIKAGDFVCRDGHFLFFLLKKSEKLPPPGDVSPRDLPKRNVHILLTHSNDWNDVSSSRRSLQLVKITRERSVIFFHSDVTQQFGISKWKVDERNQHIWFRVCSQSMCDFNFEFSFERILKKNWISHRVMSTCLTFTWQVSSYFSPKFIFKNWYARQGLKRKAKRPESRLICAPGVCGDTWCGWGIHHSIGAI